MPDYAARAGYSGMQAGDVLVLIGETHGELGCSLYLRELLGREDGAPPPVDLAVERTNGDFVRGLIRSGRARVVHDLSDGGLVCAAAEMALASGVGITLRATSMGHAHPYLFGEEEARRGCGRTPIVSLTANAMSHQVQAALEAGADFHLAKPITANDLFGAIEKMIEMGAGAAKATAAA